MEAAASAGRVYEMSANSKKTNDSNFQQQQSTSSSQIAQEQLPYLQNLWAMASGMGGQAGYASAAAQAGAQQALPGLQAGMQNLTGLMNPNSQIAQQQASLQAGLGQMFREELMPSMQSNAIAAGGFGGGRQGVAEGVAAGQMAQAYTQGLGDITARANQQALGAAGMMPGMSQALAEATYGSLYGGDKGMSILGQLAGIIGGPTVTQQSQSSGSGWGTGKSSGWGFGV